MDLKDLKPAPGSTNRNAASDAASAPASARLPAAGIREWARARTAIRRRATKAARCPCSGACPSRVFAALLKNKARRDEFVIVNLSRLGDFGEGVTIDAAALVARGLVPAGRKVKILGDGDLKSKIKVRADAFSKSARDKIAAGGGFAELAKADTAKTAKCLKVFQTPRASRNCAAG